MDILILSITMTIGAILIYIVSTRIFDYFLFRESKKEKNINPPINVTSTEKIKLLLEKDSVENINNIIDSLIKQAIDRYMILNVNFNKEAYLNEDAINELSLYAFGTVKDNMTPTVKELIGLIYDISTDEKMDEFIKLRIKIYVLAIVVKTNQVIE